MRTFIAWLLLVLFLPLMQEATASLSLDLSYKHYLGASKLEEAIFAGSKEDPLTVDVSHSLLGDEEGFQGIVKALLRREASSSEEEKPASISFISRRNRLTPRSLDGIFQTLLSSASHQTNTTQLDSDSQNTSNNQTNSDVNTTMTPLNLSAPIARPWNIDTLDLGWNQLHLDAPGWKSFLRSLQKLLQSTEVCPQSLHFDRCGLSPGACRAMGKGIINRYSTQGMHPRTTHAIKPLSLHLCGNSDLGDSGAAAIAAAIRTVVTANDNEGVKDVTLLDTLDLSACGIGDSGAEALALALESCPGMCIRHLDLSHNQLTDVGAAAIGHALLSSGANGVAIRTLDLSGNAGIKDKSAVVLAEAVEKGLVANMRLRSCHILADGAAAFGKALLKQATHPTTISSRIEMDLSGNPLGVLRGKAKKGNKYSASAIKSKATATTTAYMAIFRKGVKDGLKEFGVELGGGGNSGESDDEEEDKMGEEFLGDADLDPGKARCGIKAFSNAILEDDGHSQTNAEQSSPGSSVLLTCRLGLRHCFIDHGAADALAAVLVHAKDEMGIELSIDVSLNHVLEDEMTEAIQGDETQDDALRDMADRYLDALEAVKEARERAKEAARAAAARLQAEKDYELQWDAPDGFPSDPWEEDWVEPNDQEDEWDSDADYEQYDEEEHY